MSTSRPEQNSHAAAGTGTAAIRVVVTGLKVRFVIYSDPNGISVKPFLLTMLLLLRSEPVPSLYLSLIHI